MASTAQLSYLVASFCFDVFFFYLLLEICDNYKFFFLKDLGFSYWVLYSLHKFCHSRVIFTLHYFIPLAFSTYVFFTAWNRFCLSLFQQFYLVLTFFLFFNHCVSVGCCIMSLFFLICIIIICLCVFFLSV